jgi:hypothetical protein
VAAPLDGIVYGIASDAVGQRAWIVSLDESPTRGFIYSAPASAELCDLSVDTIGRVSWNTGKAFGHFVYTFEGRRSTEGMGGTLRRVRADDDTASFDVALRRVQGSARGADGGRLTGFYSNMHYVEEAGDLLGSNLLLLLDGDSLVGALTISEGAPSPAYPLIHARRDGDTLRFGIQTASVDRTGVPVREPEITFAAVFAGDSVHLQQSDAVEGEVLTRRGSVAEQLARNPIRGCRRPQGATTLR